MSLEDTSRVHIHQETSRLKLLGRGPHEHIRQHSTKRNITQDHTCQYRGPSLGMRILLFHSHVLLHIPGTTCEFLPAAGLQPH